MFDASCLYGTQEFLNIEFDVFDLWNDCPTDDMRDSKKIEDILKENWNVEVLGDYYFVQQNGGLVPVFDFTSTGETKGDSNAIFFGAKNEDALSPDGAANIDWVELKHVSGELANAVYRVFTVLGQPPARVSSSQLVPVTFINYFFFVVHSRIC